MGITSEAKTFDEWAGDTRWESLPWWKKLVSKRKDYCGHSWVTLIERYWEKGKRGYHRELQYDSKFCPLCGKSERGMLLTVSDWKEESSHFGY